jgi:hypothetical protein
VTVELTHYERIGPFFRKWKEHAEKFVDRMLSPESEKAAGRVLDLWEAFPLSSQGPVKDPAFVLAVMREVIKRTQESLEYIYSYGQLSMDSGFQKMGGWFIETGCPAPDAMSIIVTQYHMLNHERCGKRVYSVSAGLAEQLAHTELRGLDTDDLRLPYESIYVMVPKSAGLQVYNNETGWHSVIGVYVTEDPDINIDHPDGKSGACRGWRILVCGEPKETEIPDSEMMGGNDALSFWKTALPQGMKLDKALDWMQKVMEQDLKEHPAARFTEMETAWRAIFTWLMNVVLYVTWTEPGDHWVANKEARQLWDRLKKLPRNSSKRKNLNRRFQTLNPQRRIVVGKHIVVDRSRNSNGDLQKSGANKHDSGNALMVRTRVAGHWKRQVCGKGRSDRKFIHVEPYWRGPDGAVIATTRHEVR